VLTRLLRRRRPARTLRRRPTVRLPSRQNTVRALVAAVLAAAFAAQAVAALRPHVPLLLASTAASLAMEGVLYRWQRGMLSLFAKSHADVTVRHVLRDLLLVVGQIGRAHV
jgi:hypothetical protein